MIKKPVILADGDDSNTKDVEKALLTRAPEVAANLNLWAARQSKPEKWYVAGETSKIRETTERQPETPETRETTELTSEEQPVVCSELSIKDKGDNRETARDTRNKGDDRELTSEEQPVVCIELRQWK
jgi:hypothetical protein